jgi:hypothetical protein
VIVYERYANVHRQWSFDDWTASDDRVRGGKSQASHENTTSRDFEMATNYSQSYLKISGDQSVATFYGTLDIKTLGGAGFASQRTTGDKRSWDLSAYNGIQIIVKKPSNSTILLL